MKRSDTYRPRTGKAKRRKDRREGRILFGAVLQGLAVLPTFHAQGEEEVEGRSPGSRAADPAPAEQPERAEQPEPSSSSGIRRSPYEEVDEDIAAALDVQFGVATAEPVPTPKHPLVVTAAPTRQESRGTIRFAELSSLHDLPQVEHFVHPLETIFPKANRGDVVICSDQHIDPEFTLPEKTFAIDFFARALRARVLRASAPARKRDPAPAVL